MTERIIKINNMMEVKGIEVGDIYEIVAGYKLAKNEEIKHIVKIIDIKSHDEVHFEVHFIYVLTHPGTATRVGRKSWAYSSFFSQYGKRL